MYSTLSRLNRVARCATFSAIAATTLASVGAGCTTNQPARPVVAEKGFSESSVRFTNNELTLAGVLFTPAPSPLLNEKRPAIVLMHGCGGMVDARGRLTARHRDWAERFARWGFVALTVDSFGPRGIGPICELKERPIHPWNERTLDAYAALRYLVGRSEVDASAVFVLGWSNGGSTVMSVVRRQAPGREAAGPHFRAAVAFYPGCTLPLRQKSYRPTMPLMILHGAADDWTPAAPCVDLAQMQKSAGVQMQTITYPDAHHGFDQPTGSVRLLANVYNPTAIGARGAHVGPHPGARLAAIEEVRRFVQKALRSAPPQSS